MSYQERALAIIDRLTDSKAINIRERGTLRRAILLPKRPQGEWIAREDMDFLDENKAVHNHFQCNQCGLIHDFIDGHTSQYNFCPQCGAKMKGGTDNG